MVNEIKRCAECKFVKSFVPDNYECSHPEVADIDATPVSVRTAWVDCSDARRAKSFFHKAGKCGPCGIFFQPKKELNPDPPKGGSGVPFTETSRLITLFGEPIKSIKLTDAEYAVVIGSIPQLNVKVFVSNIRDGLREATSEEMKSALFYLTPKK